MPDDFLFDSDIVLDEAALATLDAEESRYIGSVAGVQLDPRPAPIQPTPPPAKRRGWMAMEVGNAQSQGPGTEVGNSYQGTKRGRAVSMRTCRISRLRAMGCMVCTLRDLIPLRA